MTGGALCASAGSAAHVFVAGLGADDDALEISGDDGRHLARVRRLRDGEHVTAADGLGAWRSYRVDSAGRDRLGLRAMGPLQREDPPAALCVAFAPTKGGQPELVVAALTELGVATIVPVHCERSVVRWEGERALAATARLERVAREAAMLSRRAWLPVLEPPEPFGTVIAREGAVLADIGGVSPWVLPPAPGGGRTVVVGPEGGFSPAERAACEQVARLALSRHVLSAATAPVAAAAVLLAAMAR